MVWLDIDLLELGSAAKRSGIPKISVADVEQMEALGPTVPVSVRPIGAGRYEILAGAETWLCAQRTGHDKVPVFVLDDVSDADAERFNVPGTTDPISEAEGFADLLSRWEGAKRGRVSGLARFLGLNRAYVAHSLRLLRLPDAVKDAVRQGRLSAGHARAVLRLPQDEQAATARRIERERMTVRQAEALVRDGPVREESPKDPDVLRLEQRVSQFLGCDFQVNQEDGTCTLNYHGDLEILDGALIKMGYSP